MGRISKRGANLSRLTEGKSDVVLKNRKYQAGIYARISSECSDKALGQVRKRESLDTQIEIAKKFVWEFNQKNTEEEIEIIQYYTDLGKTGSDFEREGFLQLLEDIKCGKINCVIVKDLSRLGRNYLETGNYIEKIFPFLGVRFIAISDEFDTGRVGNEEKEMASEIKNLINDMYAKDFSRKAKLSLKQRREEGSYVGGPPPYGYKAIFESGRRKLIPDENTAGIVKFIYKTYIETRSYIAVTRELKRKKINSPSQYKKMNMVYHLEQYGLYREWNKSTVERILKCKTYLGTLEQGKTGITAKNEKNRIHYGKEKWVVKKKAHKPLISEDVYQKAKDIWEKNSL